MTPPWGAFLGPSNRGGEPLHTLNALGKGNKKRASDTFTCSTFPAFFNLSNERKHITVGEKQLLLTCLGCCSLSTAAEARQSSAGPWEAIVAQQGKPVRPDIYVLNIKCQLKMSD